MLAWYCSYFMLFPTTFSNAFLEDCQTIRVFCFNLCGMLQDAPYLWEHRSQRRATVNTQVAMAVRRHGKGWSLDSINRNFLLLDALVKHLWNYKKKYIYISYTCISSAFGFVWFCNNIAWSAMCSTWSPIVNCLKLFFWSSPVGLVSVHYCDLWFLRGVPWCGVM